MSAIVVVVLFGMAGGLAVTLQSSQATIITQRMGVWESIFIVHLGGAIASGAYLLFHRGGNLFNWQAIPWYTYLAGPLGLIVIAAATYTIPRAGVVVQVFTFILGQLLFGLIIDHYGLFEAQLREVSLTRLVGIAVLCVGVWLVVR